MASIRGLGPRDLGSNPSDPIYIKNEFKIKKNQIGRKVRSTLRKEAKNLSCFSRGEAEKKTKMSFLRKARSKKALERGLEMQKMREKICV